MNARRYLTVYDYGTGGVWTFIVAPSSEAITDKYPQLKILSEPPSWMDEDRIKQMRVVQLDDGEDPFLASLRAKES